MAAALISLLAETSQIVMLYRPPNVR
jgi:hypothetical protein